jgi:hypothetical protein
MKRSVVLLTWPIHARNSAFSDSLHHALRPHPNAYQSLRTAQILGQPDSTGRKHTQLEQLSAQPNPNMNLFHVFQMLHFYMIFDDARILELHQPFSCGLSLLGVPERN